MYIWPTPLKDIWSLYGLDNSDLAVIMACDLSEKVIDPCEYLKYVDDFERMTLVRFCLLLHAHPKDLVGLSKDELYDLRDKLLKQLFNFFDPNNEKKRRFLLQVIQKPIAKWGIGCLHIERCTCNVCDNMEIMREALKEHLGFEIYRSYREREPIIIDIQTEYD